MQKDACKAYRPHLAIFRTVNGRGGFRWPSRANNEAPARSQNGQKERSKKKMHTPAYRSLFPQHFIPLFGGASGGVFYMSSLSLHEADLSTKQLRKKGPAVRTNRLQVPKRKTSQILGKEICITPEHLSYRKGIPLPALLNTVDITLSGLPRTRWHPPPSSNLRPRHFH